MKTSIVLLTYNKLDFTQLCIESIRQFTPKGMYEIIVVDNNSTDGTVKWLKTQKDLKTVFNTYNLGFPRGCNQGIKIAKGDSVLLLNNDTVVTSNWLENLRECLFSSPDIGAVGAVTNNCSNYQAIPVTYRNIDEMLAFADLYNVKDTDKWEDRLKLIGYCMLIKKEVIKNIGLLDERFTPGNYEDDDYSLRIRQAGYRLVLCQDTFIHHFGSVSFREDAEKFRNLLETNRLKFQEKWGFDPTYSGAIRLDMIAMINRPKDAAIRILEVGCACGGTLLKIKNLYKNSELHGIEINENAAKYISGFADVKVGNIEADELTYPEEFFDYIMLGDVLEHLNNPWEVVKKLAGFLKANGKVLASIPNVMHHSVIYRLINGNWTYEDSGILDKTHLRFFTLDEINKMFIEAGYTGLKVNTINSSQDSDEEFIDALSKLSNSKMKEQFKAYQYLIEACSANYQSVLEGIIANIANDIDVSNQIMKLSGFDLNNIIEVVCSKTDKKTETFNLLALKFFEAQQYDNVLIYLNKALEINQKDKETLYNLGYVFNSMGQHETALNHLEKIENKDEKTKQLLLSIKRDIDLKTELKFLVRRFENGIDDYETRQQLSNLLSSKEIDYKDVINIVKNYIIEKEAVFNLTAMLCYHDGIHDKALPLLQEAYAINPYNAQTLYNIGYVLYHHGEKEKALQYLNQIPDSDESVRELIAAAKGEK